MADTQNNIIQKFDIGGNPLSKPIGSFGNNSGQFDSLQDIAIDSKDNVYVADTGNHRIQVFDKLGQPVLDNKSKPLIWGSFGNNSGQFDSLQDIAIDSKDNVYVADTENHRIQIFNKWGEYVSKEGKYGKDINSFDHPTSLAVDSKGNIYVVDNANNRVKVLIKK